MARWTRCCICRKESARRWFRSIDVYFRDLWLVVHSLATLIVTGGCPYSDREIGSILTGFSLSICKAIKEVPGFAAGTFDRDAVFRALVGK